MALLAGVLLLGTSARASHRAYALIVGNNELPVNANAEGLAPLRYADDDAARYYQFFSRFADAVHLLAVLDATTQARYSRLSSIARAPTSANLEVALTAIESALRRDQEAGEDTSLYFVFSGHGSISDDGTPVLALTDGGISRPYLYERVLKRMPATYIHLLVDACNSGAVVGMRGFFDREVDAHTIPVSPKKALEMLDSSGLARFPNVGAIIATTEEQEAHEWSRIASGVFTHELLSAMSGAADVNEDGVVEYTEAQAFVASANREIGDPRATPKVVARAPAANLHVPLVSLSTLRDVVFLHGDFSRLGHFFVELANGQRYLDANLTGMPGAALVIPSTDTSYIRTSDAEAAIDPSGRREIRLASLNFDDRTTSTRGAIDAAYRRALFAAPYTAAYYKGYVDSIGALSVAFSDPPESPMGTANTRTRQLWTLAAFSAGGAAIITSGILVGMALKARSDFHVTEYQRQAHEANDRFVTNRRWAIAAGVAAVGAGVAGLFLWSSGGENRAVTLAPLVTPGSASLAALAVW